MTTADYYLTGVWVRVGAERGGANLPSYFAVMITDDNGLRLTDNTGLSGGLEQYWNGQFWLKFDASTGRDDTVFKIRPLLKKNTYYRLYVNPRPGWSAPYAFWWRNKITGVKDFHVYGVPASGYKDGVFSNLSGDGTPIGLSLIHI